VSTGRSALKGLRVFVVEDEIAVLMMIEDMLTTLGCEVAASATHVGQALTAVEAGDFQVAVLDVNIAGEAVYPVAQALTERRVPIVFSTGYGASGIEAQWRVWPILQKPYQMRQLAAALEQVIGKTAGG
jgi:CheY-like chemotaxis protein